MTWFAILLSVIFVILCLALILVVLLQPSQSEGLAGAFGSGGMLGSAFGVHAKNRLMKMTTVMVILFFLIIFTFAKVFPGKKGSLGEELENEGKAAVEAEEGKGETVSPDSNPAAEKKAPAAEAAKEKTPAEQPAEKKENKTEGTE